MGGFAVAGQVIEEVKDPHKESTSAITIPEEPAISTLNFNHTLPVVYT